MKTIATPTVGVTWECSPPETETGSGATVRVARFVGDGEFERAAAEVIKRHGDALRALTRVRWS